MANQSLIKKRKAWLDRKLAEHPKHTRMRLVADATGVDYGTIYKMFNSDRTPRQKYLEAILAVYPDWPLS